MLYRFLVFWTFILIQNQIILFHVGWKCQEENSSHVYWNIWNFFCPWTCYWVRFSRPKLISYYCQKMLIWRYVVGGRLLSIFTEFYLTDDVSIHLMSSLTPSSPQWVGAWWLGFILIVFLVQLYYWELNKNRLFDSFLCSSLSFAAFYFLSSLQKCQHMKKKQLIQKLTKMVNNIDRSNGAHFRFSKNFSGNQ